MYTKFGLDYEKEIAHRYHGKVVPGSGNQIRHKGDVTGVGPFLLQCKCTMGKQFVLKRQDIDKASREALEARKQVAMMVNIGGEEVLVLPSYWLDWILEKLKEDE